MEVNSVILGLIYWQWDISLNLPKFQPMELRDCCARVLYKNAKSVLGSMMKTNPQQWPRCHAIASLTQLHRILTQKSELEGTHNDPQVQI